mgnify:CR=1 FL=1
MKTSIHTVRVANELPRIGSGDRMVSVQVGRKWVHVTEVHWRPEFASRQRIPVSVWQRIRIVQDWDADIVRKGIKRARRILRGHGK